MYAILVNKQLDHFIIIFFRHTSHVEKIDDRVMFSKNYEINIVHNNGQETQSACEFDSRLRQPFFVVSIHSNYGVRQVAKNFHVSEDDDTAIH